MIGRQQRTDNADLGVQLIQRPIGFYPDIVFIYNTIVFSHEHNSLFYLLIKEVLKLTEDFLFHRLIRLEVR